MNKCVDYKLNSPKYVEAETVTEDSENSSLSNFTDAVTEVNPFLEGVGKVKNLIQELEESFRESSTVGNNLILRCVLLRAENQNLAHKIDEKQKHLFTHYLNKDWQLTLPNQEKSQLYDSKDKSPDLSKSGFQHYLVKSNCEEIDILHKTIEDLHKKLRERDKKIDQLFQKYLKLKSDKTKMENELKSKILSLEKQLDVSYNTLAQFQTELEDVVDRGFSSAKNTFEALFLQEKLRCTKLMYEKVKLHHEIKRLEDGLRRQTIAGNDDNDGWKRVKISVDKCMSEPLMRHF